MDFELNRIHQFCPNEFICLKLESVSLHELHHSGKYELRFLADHTKIYIVINLSHPKTVRKLSVEKSDFMIDSTA